MFATYVVMCMTQLRETPMAASLPAQHLKTSPKIGYAPSAESARATSRQSRSN